MSNPRPSVLETAAPPVARARRKQAHDEVRVRDEDAERTEGALATSDAGVTGIPGLPTSPLSLIE